MQTHRPPFSAPNSRSSKSAAPLGINTLNWRNDLGAFPNTDDYTCGWASRSLVKVEFSRKDLIALEPLEQGPGRFRSRVAGGSHDVCVLGRRRSGPSTKQLSGTNFRYGNGMGTHSVSRLESKAFAESGRVVYVDMEEGTVQDAKSESGRLAKQANSTKAHADCIEGKRRVNPIPRS